MRHIPPWSATQTMTPWDGCAIGVLTATALMAPLPLYFLALACFGLPHVVWELAYIRTTQGLRLPAMAVWILGGILLSQAAGRFGLWLGWLDAGLGSQLDLLTLALALGLVAALPTAKGWPTFRHGIALLSTVLLLSSLNDGAPLLLTGLLVSLSVAHNFTPLALLRLGGENASSQLPRLGFLFLLPFALLPVSWHLDLGRALFTWAPGEADWLQRHLPFPGLLSALVLAQCLHYYAVLRFLPKSLGPVWQTRPWLWPSLAASVALTGLFFWDFYRARGLYAVAAGFHAWLEWPVLLGLISAGVPFPKNTA